MTQIANITLIDEVNCKVQGIQPPTIRKCINKLKFKIHSARFLPSVRLGRWDGCISFFSAGGLTLINLLDKILPIIENDGYEINLIDNRPKFDFNFAHIDHDVVADHLWPAEHPTKPNQPITIEDHQVEIINNFLDNVKGIQVVPTSGGKTICCAILSKLVEEYGRTIVIVPNKSLVSQTEAEYKLLGLDVGVYFGDEKVWNKQHTICTWQSLNRLKQATKEGKLAENTIHDFIKDVVCVIGDEIHGGKASEMKSLLTQVFNHVPIRWGLTGTMPKEEVDVLSIIGSVGPLINTIKAKDLQNLGILSNCEIQILQFQDNSKFGSYPDELRYLTTDDARLEAISNFAINIADTGNTLILVNRIETGEKLQELIPNSVFISGGVKVKDRKSEYDQIAELDGRTIIATFGVAAVGINVPRIFNLILFEPGKSFIRTIQSIGRSLRRATDKDFATIFDVCCSTKYSKRHLAERKKFYKEQAYPFQIIKIDPENDL